MQDEGYLLVARVAPAAAETWKNCSEEEEEITRRLRLQGAYTGLPHTVTTSQLLASSFKRSIFNIQSSRCIYLSASVCMTSEQKGSPAEALSSTQLIDNELSSDKIDCHSVGITFWKLELSGCFDFPSPAYMSPQ